MEGLQDLRDNDLITVSLFGKEEKVLVLSTGDNRFDENGCLSMWSLPITKRKLPRTAMSGMR